MFWIDWTTLSMFQSTLPMKGATLLRTFPQIVPWLFQSTLPMKGATVSGLKVSKHNRVSIHAPNEGGDLFPRTKPHIWLCFNPRSQRRERPSRDRDWRRHRPCFNPRSQRRERRRAAAQRPVLIAFQSTLPKKGATRSRLRSRVRRFCFNPRSQRRERQATMIPSDR